MRSAAFGEPSCAYKPAEHNQQESEGQPSKALGRGDNSAPATTYEQELQAAKEKRDKDRALVGLGRAGPTNAGEGKQEIFAQYAAIVAALRDKYEASQADGTAPKPAAATTRNTSPAATRAGDDPRRRQDTRRPARAKRRTRTPTPDALAKAQDRLDEETRHKAKLEQLNAELRQRSRRTR